MNRSELLTPGHLARKAVIYIRQSNPHQVISNQESRLLQYALKERALSLGWQPENIQLIDSDLGRSATHVDHREGFKEMASEVALVVSSTINDQTIQKYLATTYISRCPNFTTVIVRTFLPQSGFVPQDRQ